MQKGLIYKNYSSIKAEERRDLFYFYGKYLCIYHINQVKEIKIKII